MSKVIRTGDSLRESYYTWGSPSCPIKEPVRMKEPRVCPR